MFVLLRPRDGDSTVLQKTLGILDPRDVRAAASGLVAGSIIRH